MTRDQIIEYISDDFRVDLNELNKIVIYTQKQPIDKIGAEKIPHHRYNLLYNAGELNILPYDGSVRVDHITLEKQILEEHLNKKIELEIVKDDNTASKMLDDAIGNIVSNIGDNFLQGVIIGSVWNINFLINHRLRKHIYSDLFKEFDEKEIDDYISHRLRLSTIENALLDSTIPSIKNVDPTIFQEGGLPSKDTFNYVQSAHHKLNITLQKTELLNDYLALDYIFFNDLKHNTHIFEKTTSFAETQIFSNDLLTYQIIDIPNKQGKYLNISWIEPITLGQTLEKLQQNVTYKES